MAFTVHGTIGGQTAMLRWNDGAISGDAFAVALVQALVDEGIDIGWTATGPWVFPALDDPEVALLTIGEVFDPEPVLTGDVPDPPQLPPLSKGAVA